MKDSVGILGAGPAGLCAAINLAREGVRAKVHERKKAVGMRFHPNLQGLRYVDGDPEGFMKSVGVKSKLKYRYFPKACVCTRKRDIWLDISVGNQMPFVVRGGEESLEAALFSEARKLGVEFEFSSRATENDARVIASGGKEFSSVAVGSVFEESDFPRDAYAVIYDDRYSPRGWYSYLIPFSKDRLEFVTCVSRPYAHLLSKLHAKAIAERKIVRDFVFGRKKVGAFGGGGDARIPKSAFLDGKYLVGEAAGFQDPFMGFGIVYALKSGKLAADAIASGKGGAQYDADWKREIMPKMKKDFARRLPMSLFGDFAPEILMGKYKDGQKTDFGNAIPEKNLVYPVIQELAYGLEVAKKRITGEW